MSEKTSSALKISDLPSELIEYILTDKDLSVRDVCNAAQTCRKLNGVAQSNELWRKKLKRRWPDLVEKYPRGASHWWQDVYKYQHSCRQRVQAMVKEFSPLYYSSDEISKDGFLPFMALMEESEHSPMAVIDELMETFRHGERHSNLTNKYYAEKVLRYLLQLHLSHELTAFLAQPSEDQLIENGAVLVAQWCQPTVDITEACVSRMLDAIAVRVENRIKERHPTHPVCSVQLNSDKPLYESQWKPAQCRQVLEAVNQVLYTDMGFSGNSVNYYSPENSYINKVLERRIGIPISLAIVYSAVARRLGVLCSPVNFPSHFLLKWREHPMLPDPQQDTYIDVFRAGRFLTQQECGSALQITQSALNDPKVYSAIEPRLVYERMARNLVYIGRQQGQMGDSMLCLRNALELYLVISPDDLEKRLLLARVNLHLNINLPDVVESLQRIADMDQAQMSLVTYMISAAQALIHEEKSSQSKEIKAKTRAPNSVVDFSVGMIMKHKRYHYMCLIYGWDPVCKASPEWILQMGVNNLPKKDTQPFYNVLVQDGSNRYAAQENLEFAENSPEITHPEVGKYFQEYCKTYYKPNTEKMMQYPEDLEITRRKTAQFYHVEN
ncbi:F-box only protein 21-like [Liolophura sinensis]|uniref:F-box only protein 21-like n=1 Tax=Liolophura sinensis TaxID=3198878 RepID=UPI00315960C2